MERIISFGHAVIDCYLKGMDYKNALTIKAEEFPEAYHKNISASYVGGAPVNVASYFSLLGGEATLITAVANDEYGAMILKELMGYGVNYILINTAKSDFVLILLQQNEHCFVKFIWNSLPLLSLPQIKTEGDIVYITSLETLFPLPRHTLKLFVESKHMLCFDPNLREKAFTSARSMFQSIDWLLSKVNIIKLNMSELLFIAKSLGFQTPSSAKEFIKLTEQVFRFYSPEILIVTLGEIGAIACSVHGIVWSPSYTASERASCVGAGDAFTAAFLKKIQKNYNKQLLIEALRFGCMIAGISVTQPSTIVDKVKSYDDYSLEPLTDNYNEFLKALNRHLKYECLTETLS